MNYALDQQNKQNYVILLVNSLPIYPTSPFDSKNYNRLAEELNPLVEEFQALDRNHHISKLHAYVSQWGILRAWNNLRTEGVKNLSPLPPSEQSLQKLFQMGE